MKASRDYWTMILVAAFITQAAGAAPALTPHASWDISGIRNEDVTCDGHPDLIMTGHDGKTLYVTVTSGPKVSRTFHFAIDGSRQDGVCALPVHIETYPLTCKDDEYGVLPGCRETRHCRAFKIVDNQCDSLNFYWNFKARRLEWFRH